MITGAPPPSTDAFAVPLAAENLYLFSSTIDVTVRVPLILPADNPATVAASVIAIESFVLNP